MAVVVLNQARQEVRPRPRNERPFLRESSDRACVWSAMWPPRSTTGDGGEAIPGRAVAHHRRTATTGVPMGSHAGDGLLVSIPRDTLTAP